MLIRVNSSKYQKSFTEERFFYFSRSFNSYKRKTASRLNKSGLTRYEFCNSPGTIPDKNKHEKLGVTGSGLSGDSSSGDSFAS